MQIRRIIIALLPACALAFASLCAAQDQPQPAAPAVATKEYFVQQGADEALVVRVRAFEADFVSRLTTIEGEKLSESALPDSRMLPLYQFLAEPGKARQVDVDVVATQVTNRTEFELELIRLNVRDERSADLANAYRFLALGLEAAPGASDATWTVKVQALLRAEGLFAEIGMEELRITARLYAAHLVLHQLRDVQTARDWASDLLALPRIDRFETIAFAASKIRSSALAQSTAGASGNLQSALEDTISRAQALGFRLEEALALQASAVDLMTHGSPAPALERLQRALAIAEAISAAELTAAIREHIVEIYDEFGDALGEEVDGGQATGKVLQDIETHLLTTGESEELARNLLQQGRLHLAADRYAEAIDVLSRAVVLEQSTLSRIEVELALGNALNDAGRSDEALVHLYRALVQPDTGDFRKPSPGFEFFAALGNIAAIHRQQADFERMDRIREAQEGYARDAAQRSEWAYQRAMDALLARGPSSAGAGERFAAAEASGEGTWQALSLLRLCALPTVLNGNDARCGDDAERRAFEAARTGGDRRQAAEAALAYARLLGLRGQIQRALAIAEAQVDELLVAGRAPLGAWYWQWRGALIENYLALATAAEGNAENAFPSLLALAQARAVERGAGAASKASEAGLRDFLKSLPRDWAVLSYFLAESGAQAWIARRSGTRRVGLDSPEAILTLCAALRHAIQSKSAGEFDSLTTQLGARLLEPVFQHLPETVLLVSQGPLLGIPFDALVVKGEPLAAHFAVIHLDRFPAAPAPTARLDPQWPGTVFLGGDPQDWSGDYAARLEPSLEVRAVTDHFVGPGLHAVQGVALLVDELDDERLGRADLVHLSVPGPIDLSPARESALFLSEPARGEGRQRLGAAALRELPLHADLVFMSRTEFEGVGSLLESDLGVVSAALDAGAGAVIASLWPIGDEARGRFVPSFYAQLENSGDAAIALALTKRQAMREGGGYEWASFQLFLN